MVVFAGFKIQCVALSRIVRVASGLGMLFALILAGFAGAQGVEFGFAAGMGGTSGDEGLAVAVDGAGNVYTTGYFQGTVDFDPGAGVSNLTSAGTKDIFVQKLDSAGNFVWAKGFGGTDNDRGFGIVVDASGNVFSTGEFSGTVDFDPGLGVTELSSAGGLDVFVQKLDAAGDFVWAKGMG
ncbi:MAG: hypothetical protein L3K26_09955, partial [Candidatus Hydrogenedentes bacterium]|nr:hypothetical protein [Candidatus Hydrogenedentota bacterium]